MATRGVPVVARGTSGDVGTDAKPAVHRAGDVDPSVNGCFVTA
jgi:hypothetical protein